ncbi:MAG: carbon monoxide dehydrogenase accessory protein CooC [Thermodesulfovibrionales bacterium]
MTVKIAVTGKGGVGKTTISSTLCHIYAREGKRVLAVDADPDANLAAAFGLDKEAVLRIRPIAEMTELIEERTGARPGASGGLFKINPRVDDIPEEYGYSFDGIRLLITGRSKEAASGCYCPENVLLRRLLKHLVVERDEVVVLDMEAGIEHLTRGTAEAVDAFLVVVEPGQRSIQTALTVRDMARGLGVRKVFVAANKVRTPEDVEFIKGSIDDMVLAGALSFDPAIMEADMKGRPAYETSGKLVEEVRAIRDRMEAS